MNSIDWTITYWTISFIAGLISVSIVLYLIPYRRYQGSRLVMLLMISVAIWSFTSAGEIRATSLTSKLLWVKLEYVGGSWVGVFFLFFILVFTGREKWLTPFRKMVFGVVPILTTVFALTNDIHHLLWVDAWLEKSGSMLLLAYHRGIGFLIFIGYTHLLMAIGTIIVMRDMLVVRSVYRKRLVIVLAGAIVPWASNTIYLSRITPFPNIDFTPFAVTISGILFAWGLYHYQLIRLISMARNTMIEGMVDVVLVLDSQDQILDMNRAAEELFKTSFQKTRGKPISNLSAELETHINSYRGTTPSQHEINLSNPISVQVWNLRISPLHEKTGEPDGWLVMLQNITDRRNAEEAVKESEEKFRSITANALDGIVMINSEGKITLWNKAAESILKYSAEEALGMNLHKMLASPELSKKYYQAAPKFAVTGTGPVIGKTVELNAVCKDGEVIPVELSTASLMLKGEWNAVGVVRDISFQKRSRELMIQSEKMISVGRLAAGMAHEINNPLGGIVQGAQILRGRLSSDMEANKTVAREIGVDMDAIQAYIEKREISKFLNSMHELGIRAATIISDVLQFSRKSELAKTLTDLTESINNSIELAKKDYDLKKNFDFRDVEVITHFDPDTPMVYCHQIEIEQVILNLLRNAAQAMTQTSGQRPPRIEVRLSADENLVRIDVEDNGPGMSATTKNRIFEPFYTTKAVGQGTGLGLSVSYTIITHNHHGTMKVESEPGKGTKFIILLPINQTDQT